MFDVYSCPSDNPAAPIEFEFSAATLKVAIMTAHELYEHGYDTDIVFNLTGEIVMGFKRGEPAYVADGVKFTMQPKRYLGLTPKISIWIQACYAYFY